MGHAVLRGVADRRGRNTATSFLSAAVLLMRMPKERGDGAREAAIDGTAC